MLSKRKGLAFILTASMLVMAACGGASKTGEVQPASTPVQAVPKEPVTIQFWHGMDENSAHGKVLTELVQAFNSSQSEVIVEATFQGAYSEIEKKLVSALQTPTPPHVVQATDSMLIKLYDQEALQALDSFVSAKERADYPAGFLQALTFAGGKLYALPFNKSMLLMIYNKNLVTSPPKSWEEFKEAAVAASVKDQRYGTAFSADVYYFGTHFGQTAGHWLDKAQEKVLFNSPEGVQALTLVTDMVKNGSAIQLKPKEYQSDYFNQGRAAMIVTTSASLAYIKPVNGDPWGAAPLYQGPANGSVPIAGANLAMVSGLKPEEQAAAATFMLWLTGTEATLKWATGKTGYVPVRKSAVESPAWKSFVKENPEYEALGLSLDKGVTQPNHPKWGEIQKLLTTAVEKAVLGTDPKMALDEAAGKANEILGKP